MTDEQTILTHLSELHEKTGGHNGIYLPQIEKLTGKRIEELKNILNKLFTEGKIQVREGVNGKMIMKK